ncbi:MAG: hypothetical protein ACM3W7_09985 [Acidobacteriota bacterium]
MAQFTSFQYPTFLFTYRHDGAEWTLEVKARDLSDAKERLKALPFARYDGELIAKVPVSLGPLMKVAVWLRNVCPAF